VFIHHSSIDHHYRYHHLLTSTEYFHNVKALLRRLGAVSSTVQYIGPAEEALMAKLESAKTQVRSALLDDFDTPRAVTTLTELIKDCNKYMDSGVAMGIANDNAIIYAQAVTTGLSSVVLTNVARYITTILRTFGLVPSTVDIGFPLQSSHVIAGGSDDPCVEAVVGNREAELSPLLDVLTTFRQQVRLAAIGGDVKVCMHHYLYVVIPLVS